MMEAATQPKQTIHAGGSADIQGIMPPVATKYHPIVKNTSVKPHMRPATQTMRLNKARISGRYSSAPRGVNQKWRTYEQMEYSEC